MKEAEKILQCVLSASGVSLHDFRSPSRARQLCFARMAYTKIRRDMGAKVEVVAAEINRDHSTVSHITAVHKSDYRYCPQYHEYFDHIKDTLKEAMQ